MTIWPRQHHVAPPDRVREATAAIRREMVARAAELRAEGSHIEAERLEQRTTADVGLLEELGWCPGAEHHSRHLAGRAPGNPPVTLLDTSTSTRGEETSTRTVAKVVRIAKEAMRIVTVAGGCSWRTSRT